MPEYKKNVQGKHPRKKPNKFLNVIRLFMFWMIVIILGMAIILSLNPDAGVKSEERTLTEVLTYAKEEKLEKIELHGNELLRPHRHPEGEHPHPQWQCQGSRCRMCPLRADDQGRRRH